MSFAFLKNVSIFLIDMLNAACYRIIRLQIKVITTSHLYFCVTEKALHKDSLKDLKSNPMFNKTNGLDTVQRDGYFTI